MKIDSDLRYFAYRAPKLAAAAVTAGMMLCGCSTTLAGFEPAREVVCFGSARIALADAVGAAEREGGRVIDAHYHQPDELGCLSGNPGSYEIVMVREGAVSGASVDARSGAVAMRKPSNYPGKIFAGDSQSQARSFLRIPLRLGDAIAAAERDGGKAMKAYAETRGGIPGYVVKLVKDGGKVRAAFVSGGELALADDVLFEDEISYND